MIEKKVVLEKAISAVADREGNYDSPADNFRRIARLWHAHLLNRYERIETYRIPPLDAVDVAIMCDMIKTSRLEFDPTHLDSWVDKAGYAACGANCTVKIDDESTVNSAESSLRWIDGIEYERTNNPDGFDRWCATGRHHPGLTNTPRRGEVLGSRNR